MKSMTGYGKGISVRDNKTLTVELKAVNNRFLEINARLPKYLVAGEGIVRQTISSVVRRGTIDFYFDYKDLGSDKTLCIDYELAAKYKEAADEIAARLNVKNELSTTDMMKFGDVVTVVSETNTELICEMLQEATKQAVDALNEMRIKEGESVYRDFVVLINNIKEHLEFIKGRAPVVVTEYREKLKKRIEEYLGEIEPDEARIVNEVAFFADKADINEEISRLGSHIGQFIAALELSDEVGRKLDFISQEMNREINTMGSKSNDIEITNRVVAMKNELEKIKEQIRNVE